MHKKGEQGVLDKAALPNNYFLKDGDAFS